jgi:hypothetical protein
MNQDLVSQFALDLARLQRIMGKAPLDYKVKECHINFLKELADCATQIAQMAGALLPSPDE